MEDRFFRMEKNDPGKNREKEILHHVQKLKRIIEKDQKLTPEMESYLEKAEEALNKMGIEVDSDELTIGALEMLRKEWSGLPDKLMKSLVDMKERHIAKEIVEGGNADDFHSFLGKRVVEARRNGLELDGKKIEGHIREMTEHEDEAA